MWAYIHIHVYIYILIFIIIIVSDVGLLLYHRIIMRLEQHNICGYTYAYIILLLNRPQVRKQSFSCAKNILQTHRFNLLKNTALCKCFCTIYRVTCKSINSIRSRHTHYCQVYCCTHSAPAVWFSTWLADHHIRSRYTSACVLLSAFHKTIMPMTKLQQKPHKSLKVRQSSIKKKTRYGHQAKTTIHIVFLVYLRYNFDEDWWKGFSDWNNIMCVTPDNLYSRIQFVRGTYQ